MCVLRFTILKFFITFYIIKSKKIGEGKPDNVSEQHYCLSNSPTYGKKNYVGCYGQTDVPDLKCSLNSYIPDIKLCQNKDGKFEVFYQNIDDCNNGILKIY